MNAGRPPQWLPVSEGDADIWWDTVDVSLRGAYNFSHFALPTMQRQNGGRIIFTSSAGAHANRGVSSYIVAKLGMVRLAEIIHAENFEKHNVKAFAIHPGNVATRFFHDFKDKAEGHTKERSYLKDGRESEERSAQNATNFFKDATWDTPYMAAGMVCVLSSGQLDFMSGRYVDCSLKVEGLVEQSKSIVQNDLYRVRLHAAEGKLIPNLNF
jgi:NAD(P)-dependent dehydrogenase (short-subunit alcohol dehydrogenase family)